MHHHFPEQHLASASTFSYSSLPYNASISNNSMSGLVNTSSNNSGPFQNSNSQLLLNKLHSQPHHNYSHPSYSLPGQQNNNSLQSKRFKYNNSNSNSYTNYPYNNSSIHMLARDSNNNNTNGSNNLLLNLMNNAAANKRACMVSCIKKIIFKIFLIKPFNRLIK